MRSDAPEECVRRLMRWIDRKGGWWDIYEEGQTKAKGRGGVKADWKETGGKWG